ncbi:MAG TPA: hypothetical protein VMV61_11800 [Patescibacteria group bacterium]|nr:hypothetical protein [Patescibacteria group bacterium]
MIGMSFGSFLTLLILGFIAAIIMHAGFRYRMMAGFDGFLAKWVAGWIGAWLGTPVLGHWWLQIQNVYIIPALVGAFVGAFFLTFVLKASSVASATAEKITAAPVTTPGPEMLRKAS